MKMGFLLKNNARRGMGEEGVLKKGEEKEYSKRERKRSAQKGREKGVLKKGEKKECSKKGEEKEAEKGREKGVLKKGEEKEAEKSLQNSRILKRMAGWAEIRKF